MNSVYLMGVLGASRTVVALCRAPVSYGYAIIRNTGPVGTHGYSTRAACRPIRWDSPDTWAAGYDGCSQDSHRGGRSLSALPTKAWANPAHHLQANGGLKLINSHCGMLRKPMKLWKKGQKSFKLLFKTNHWIGLLDIFFNLKYYKHWHLLITCIVS